MVSDAPRKTDRHYEADYRWIFQEPRGSNRGIIEYPFFENRWNDNTAIRIMRNR